MFICFHQRDHSVMNIFTSHLEKSRKDGELLVTQLGSPRPHPVPWLQPIPSQSPQLLHQPEDFLGGDQWLNLTQLPWVTLGTKTELLSVVGRVRDISEWDQLESRRDSALHTPCGRALAVCKRAGWDHGPAGLLHRAQGIA